MNQLTIIKNIFKIFILYILIIYMHYNEKDYKQKYLKYKVKYLELKRGGGDGKKLNFLK
jgi:hypothetical protein